MLNNLIAFLEFYSINVAIDLSWLSQSLIG